jgi:[protein-PII] uridylyltransferase
MPTRLRPARIEFVVDGAALRSAMTATALAYGADSQETGRRVRELLHGALFRGRMIAKERLEAGENGLAVARLLSQVADQVISALYDFTTVHVFRSRNPTQGERFAIVAVGGYGRGQLAPSSDVDLLFLRAYKQTAWSESVTEYMLYVLWDLGLKVGHAARTIDESVRLAKSDHTIETALLEARHITGEHSLFVELRDRFRHEVAERRHAAFIAAKLKERDERHQRAGASRYMVEPNIKEGKGGLRDLHTLFWLARHRHGFDRPKDYVAAGVFTVDEYHTFRRAEEFLWTVRCHLHFLTGRAEERLSFDLQPEMAARLGFVARGEQSAVERFMKRYFLAAKQVGALTRSLCARLEAAQEKSSPLGLSRSGGMRGRLAPLNEPGFHVASGRLSIDSADVFDEPHNLLRLYEIADRRNLDVHPDALVEASRQLKKITRESRRDPRAVEAFLAVAASERQPGVALRLMNETGVLGRFLPEFGRIVAQTQFNMYHSYTVDEHTLRAVDYISAIEQGRFENDHPLATEIFPKLQNRRALYLAMLLHDTGKGIGDQQIEGEISARRACTRLGLPKEEVELVAWLVRHHLDMSDCAQKRDIGDPATVAQFAQLVGTTERLRLLLVLTVADIRAVGPGVWNGWKGQLLRDLYRLTEAALLGGRMDEGALSQHLADLARKTKGRFLAELGMDGEAALVDWIERFEDAYWLGFDSSALHWHAREVRAAANKGAPVHAAARPRPTHGVTELLVYAPDRPRLFADLCAAIAASGGDIARARIHTTRDGAAFDVFSVQTVDHRPFGVDEPDMLADLVARVREAATAGCPAPQGGRFSKRQAAFAIEPWVRADNSITPHATVVEVSGRDRPGVLAQLAAAFAEAGVEIVSAHVDAHGERLSDTFYVQAEPGAQLADPARLRKLTEGLEAVLRADEPDPPSDAARRTLAVAPASTAR